MNTNDSGVERVRALLAGDRRVTEKKLFGGLGFMLGGNMVCGFTAKGEFMVRFAEDREGQFRQLPGAGELDFNHRMGSMVFVPDHTVGDDADLALWVTAAIEYVSDLPAK